MKFILFVAFASAVLPAAVAAQEPILPGLVRLRSGTGSTAAERGVVLLAELSCAACHTATEVAHVAPRAAPNLEAIGGRVTTSWLRDYLTDPRVSKPGTLMPNCMPGANDERRTADVDALVHYLASRGGPLRPATVPVSDKLVASGRDLFRSVGCVACHAPGDGRQTEVPSVPLGKLAHKMTVDSLRKFLADPRKVRPAGRMPSLWLSDDESLELSMFLLRGQIDNPQADLVRAPSGKGLAFEYFELGNKIERMPDLSSLTAKVKGSVNHVRFPRRARRNDFALRLHGEIEIAVDGAYTFELQANGGARLRLGGYVVIDDDGETGKSKRTGQVELRAGQHAIEIEYFQRGRGRDLKLSWILPGGKNRLVPDDVFSNRGGRAMVPLESPLPKDRPSRDKPGRDEPDGDVVDGEKAKIERGRELFLSLRCAACHEPNSAWPRAKALAEIDAAADGSCLSAKPAVDFGLSAVQRTEIRTALTQRAWAQAREPAANVRHEFAAMNCYGCHARGEIGGPESARYEFFKTKISIDLGDEGKVPPPLTAVGAKLRPDVLVELIAGGEHRIRERFMATRMPGFPKARTVGLVASLLAADGNTADRLAVGRAVGAAAGMAATKVIEAGRRLVGTTGLGCVTCHNVNGDRAAAIPGIDLASAQARLTRSWFHKFMRKPSAFRKDTRMPGFWAGETSPFADILDGTTQTQIDAIWTYLSLGKSIPAPRGVQGPDGGPKAELLPRDEPIVHRTFMTGVGARAILAGFPEKLHVAFDAHAVRMAKVWRGRFFDASGVASGRSGKFLGPLGDEVLDLPGPAFARLARADAGWPVIAKNARDVGGEFQGLTLDKGGRPTFRYRSSGVEIREQPIPRLRIGGASLRRLFVLSADTPPIDFYFRAWRGKKIEQIAAGTWRSGGVTIVLKVDRRDPVRIRTVDGAQELVVLFVFRGEAIRFEEEIRW